MPNLENSSEMKRQSYKNHANVIPLTRKTITSDSLLDCGVIKNNYEQ